MRPQVVEIGDGGGVATGDEPSDRTEQHRGLALSLLAMQMMTDGLKVFAGGGLKQLLSRYTIGTSPETF